MQILDVDLGRFEKGDSRARAAAVDGVMQSLRVGFVYLEHDLPSDLLDRCYARLEAFFSLDSESKRRSAVPGSRGQRGYTGVLIETAAQSSHADWKETLNWGETAPPGSQLEKRYPDRYGEPVFPEVEIPGIGEDLMRFHRQILGLQRRFLRIVAIGLGAPESFFDAMTEHGATLTRAAHYPPMSRSPGAQHVWAGEHGDINLVTALPRATARGLQVKTAEGWIDAMPPEGRAIMNTGMMLEHFSNGLLPTGIHRVVAAPEQVGDRIAVVQFCHPTPDTVLEPIPSCVRPDHPCGYPRVSAAQRLDEVLREIKLDGGHSS